MGLVPDDFPQRLANRGVDVNVIDGWQDAGAGSADHQAIALHHTASSANESPSSCANYCFSHEHYNVLVDRTGVAWVGMRHKSNNAGELSSVPLNEAKRGEAGTVSAVERGLSDDDSDNAALFAVSCQNNGVGEHWSDLMVDTAAIVSAVALEGLGIPNAGHCTQHRILTARKIDNCGDSCPYDWRPLVADALGGRDAEPEAEADEMWLIHGVLPGKPSEREANTILELGLPVRKWANVRVYSTVFNEQGPSLWGTQLFHDSNEGIGLWDEGQQWELWLPGRYVIETTLHPDALAIRLENKGAEKNRDGSEVQVTIFGM